MARGGTRTGTPGKAYKQRTDMQQPVRVVTGQAYGQAQALQNAQRAIPLPNNQAVPAPISPASPAAAGGPGPPALPGQNDFLRPTERPGEPVTAGIPSGPGPGPEALSTIPPADPNQADAQQWARYLPSLEFMASQPDASMSTRNFV